MLRQQIGGGSFGRRVLCRESCCRFRGDCSLRVFRGECNEEKLQWPFCNTTWMIFRSKPPKVIPAYRKFQHEVLDGVPTFPDQNPSPMQNISSSRSREPKASADFGIEAHGLASKSWSGQVSDICLV